MHMILSVLIGKYAKFFWPTIIMIVVYFYWDGRNDTLRDQQRDIDALQTELDIRKVEYATNEKKLKDAITDQNSQIVSLTEQFERNERDAVQLITAANTLNQTLTERLQNQIDLINDIDTPQTCQSAIDLVVDVAIDNKWSTTRD